MNDHDLLNLEEAIEDAMEEKMDKAAEEIVEAMLDNYEMYRKEPCLTLCTSSPAPPPVSVVKSTGKRAWTPKQSMKALAPTVMTCKKIGCGSTEIIEDASVGSVVCIQCGMIQCTSVFEGAGIDAYFHGGVSRTVVHRYSRIVYLRAILLSLLGETRVDLDLGEWIILRQYFQREENLTHNKDASSVKRAIRSLKLPYRLMRHAYTIAWQLWKIPLPVPSGQEIRDVFRLFRVFESAWDRAPLAGSIRKGRKKFPAYAVVWKHCCRQLEYDWLEDLLPPLRSKKLEREQMEILNQLVGK